MTFPIVMTKDGPVPMTPEQLRAMLVAAVEAINPGFTANLPASLIEDIVSTDVGAMLVMDSAITDLINSVTPKGANEFILNQLGQIYGVEQGQGFNTSVFCVFIGPEGWTITPGFLVSDGTHQYRVVDGGIIATGGQSSPLYCLATTAGIWAVPAGTVTILSTSVPDTITVTVTNPTDGTPGTGVEPVYQYRAQVLQAGLAGSQGMPRYLRTLLNRVSGVQSRLVSIQQQSPGWKILVGGGDPYEVADAIFSALFDVSTLVGADSIGTTITATIYNYPDTYNVTYVSPELQDVSVTVEWDTSSPNFISPAAVSQYGAPGILEYVNSIPAGQPMILYELQNAFATAIQDIVPRNLLTTMNFTVSIDGTPTPPEPDTGEILGDSEGYFYTTLPAITVSPVL